MTNVRPCAVWPSISPISEIHGDAVATPIGLGERQGQGQDRGNGHVINPVQDIPGPPEPHAEMRVPRVARRPILPTKADIAEHFPLHLNYRS